MTQRDMDTADRILENTIYPLMMFREGLPSEGKIVNAIAQALHEARIEGREEAIKIIDASDVYSKFSIIEAIRSL
jgi:hypothetical protein